MDKQDYFSRVSAHLDRVAKCPDLDDISGYSVEELQELFDGLYRDILPENYEKSFLYPPTAREVFGREMGSLLSAIYADIMGTSFYAVRQDKTVTEIFKGLFSDIREAYEKGGDDSYEDIKAIYRSFWKKNGRTFAASSIKEMVISDSDDLYHRLCSEENDFSDIRRLYKYGYYITDNEKQIAKFVASMSEDEVEDMARVFVEGYIKGFEVTGRDIGIKDTVKCEYPIGFERVISHAIRLFKERQDLQVTFTAEPVFSYMSRGASKRAVRATSVNRRFYADHKDDKALYWDRELMEERLSDLRQIFESHREAARAHGGPAVIEDFGEAVFTPDAKSKNAVYSDEQNKLNVEYANRAGEITNEFIPGDERSFTIISYPLPEIGDKFEEIFAETVRINTLDYELYRDVQQHIIDALDQGEYVEVKGAGDNITDIKVMLHPLDDNEKQTNFENCVADVNIPVGEVFTSPVLEGTEGTLFVSHVFLNGYEFKNLRMDFADGKVTDYECTNYADRDEGRKFIKDNILFHHDTLPIGEFAIGTNTAAYAMARKYAIEDVLPILIMEKTGPHFAVGDTCYSHAEDVPMFNPDGKECIARHNSFSIEKKYFNCHTDITIPFEELKRIAVVDKLGNKTDIIRDGKFLLPGTEVLNESLKGA